MFKVTPHSIRMLCPNAKQSIIDGVASYFNSYAGKYGIDTDLELCHFFAQAAVETAWFQTLEEFASGREYEGRTDLGNTQPGDGVRYKGRGIFQTTGRYNYARFGKIMGLDLVNSPELLLNPEYAVVSALEYWKYKNIGPAAAADDVNRVTYLINGGYNGLNDRRAALAKMKVIVSNGGDEISLGDRGQEVENLQIMLKLLGYKVGVIDGLYGPATNSALRMFQSDNGLPQTGSANDTTLKLLEKKIDEKKKE
jgi:putative chitinase